MKLSLLLTFILLILIDSTYGGTNQGNLVLSIVDSTTGTAVPARVEITGSDGNNYIAKDALLFGGDCDQGSDADRNYSLDSAISRLGKEVKNSFTSTTQFYSTGKSEIILPNGVATIKITKGPEYEVVVSKVEISPNNNRH